MDIHMNVGKMRIYLPTEITKAQGMTFRSAFEIQ